MTFEEYTHSFSKLAFDSGYSESDVNRFLRYAENLFINKVPVIYSESHLSSLVGYKVRYLIRAGAFTSSYYRYFEISKRNGTKRQIAEPLPSLKEIQLWILNNILYEIEISPFAKAYVPRIGIVENLKFHKKQNKVFSIDLKDFFQSIPQNSIEAIFHSLGYTSKISRLLAKLCCLNGTLPQGAPTSPFLSNIFFKNADFAIGQFCLKNKIRYTRYADDLTFSGDFDEKSLYEFVRTVVGNLNLQINTEKVKLMTPNERQVVTGIVVNQKIQVAFKKRNLLRQEMYYIQKFGILSHIEKKGINKSNYLEHLIGKVNFILHLNPDDSEFISYKRHLYSIKKLRIQ